MKFLRIIGEEIHCSTNKKEKKNNMNNRDKILIALNEALKTKNKNGMVDYKVIVENIGQQVNYGKMKSVVGEMPISASLWSRIVGGKSRRTSSPRRGSRELSEERKILIRDFWLSPAMSKVSPHCLHVIRRKSKNHPVTLVDNVYYRKYTIKRSYEIFKEQYPDVKIGRTTFFKYKPQMVKKSKSKLDCCPICKEYSKYRQFLDTGQLNAVEIKAKNAFEFHEDIKQSRQNDFECQIENLKDSEAVLVMDFKANISLGKGPEEDSHIFFNAPQRSLFGVACYFRKNGKTYKVIFTIMSSVLMHDSKTVIEMINEHVLNNSLFNYFGVKTVKFWMDNAPNHFRTKEMLAGFYALERKFDVSVEVNYFAEYYGKSECERHFGLISRIYTEHCSYTDNSNINTTEEFIDMYTNYMREFGGNVIPKLGANHDELHEITSSKLNVVARIFSYPEINVDELVANEGERSKVITVPMAYERKVMKEMSKFAINNFYSFTFRRFDNGKNQIIGKLKHFSKATKCNFAIEDVYKPDYSVKIGVRSAQVPKFNNISRTLSKMRFHSSD